MSRSMFGWVRAALLGSVVAGLAACGSSGSSDATTAGGGTGCTPGEQKSCACPGGTQGVQTCAEDGRSLNACECGASSGTAGTGSGGAGGTSTGTHTSDCGDGVQQPGECLPDSETHFYCKEDCDGTTASGSTGSTGAGGACAGHVFYAGMVPNVSSVWVSGGLTSFAAGDDMCQKANLGADHVCDYEEVLKAYTANELTTIAAGTTVWVQRTTSAMIGGVPSAPGPGGRCNDWKYNTNHIADGEYATFTTMGTPTYHLDSDTIFDNMPGLHNDPTDMPCNGVTRAIMCCYAKCD
jgi:hypothetical protein